MAAPSTITRSTPAGIWLDDGHATKIAFALDADISFWEKTVQPPGLDGGEPIDTTTMFNVLYKTKAPRTLVEYTEIAVTASYDPNVYNNILAIINREGSITLLFPDGSKIDFYGYLQKFEPQDNSEGEQPMCNITIVVTNWDPTNRVEVGAVITSVAGT